MGILEKENVYLPATNPFLLKSSFVRSARNTSASSSKRMQSHLLASEKFFSRAVSTSVAVVPRSPDTNIH